MAATPSVAHQALAQLEARHADFTLATQNVDSLHVRAGSRNVIELHGQLREARCTGCTARRPLDDPLPLDSLEHDCGGRWRPDIVWFGESLPTQAWRRAIDAAGRADLMLVVGTSAMVHPAASIATRFAPRAYVVEINPNVTPLSAQVDASIRARAADVLPQLV
jgi:NAD-dependent deacetylase